MLYLILNSPTSVQEGEPRATETRQSRKIILHFFTIFVLLFTKYFSQLSQFPQILPGNPHQKSKNLKQRARCRPYHIPTGTTALRVRKIALRSNEGGDTPLGRWSTVVKMVGGWSTKRVGTRHCTGEVVNGHRDGGRCSKEGGEVLSERGWPVATEVDARGSL